MTAEDPSQGGERDLPRTVGLHPPDYYFWGNVPVRFLPAKEGGVAVERLDPKTGEFVNDAGMVSEIFFRPWTSTDIERVGERAFNRRVEEIRRQLKG